MFDFLKKLFSSTPTFGMGSLPSPADSRNIMLAEVQSPTEIPDSYMTDISMLGVENQGSAPICVGESVSKIAQYYVYKQTGKIVKFDPQQLYDKCKKEDGIPDQSGTFANIAAKIVIRDGIDESVTGTNDKITTGYAFVTQDFASICQAIYQNGLITIGMMIGSNWFSGIIGRALRYIGGHQTDLHGYDIPAQKLYGLNSWGIGWIGQIAGLIDSKVKPGFYVALFDDIKDSILNIIALTPIPKNIIDDVKNIQYRFLSTIQFGSTGYEVMKLQERLNLLADGRFGSKTKSALIAYQIDHKLPADGVLGPKTRAIMNQNTTSFIPKWMSGIKDMEGAKPSRNNPGNLRFVGQEHAINDNGFCKFDTLEHGQSALESILVNACTGKSKNYSPDETLYEFYAGVPTPNRFGRRISGYAPSSDGNDPKNYANFVAKRMGVSIDTRIGDLV